MVTSEEAEIKEIDIHVPKPHSEGQEKFVRCTAKRQIAKSGRRWGKTVAVSIKAEEAFLGVCPACGGSGCLYCDNTGKVRPKRVLYAAPTIEQVTKFWFEITSALAPGIELGLWKKDETEKIIEIPKTEIRIKAKTAWNANTMRGDWGDLVIMEEYQLWNEDAWQDVVQPMLVDTDGTAVFIYTPPSLKSEGVSKAKDPRHASKLYQKALQDKSGRWACFHYTTYDNPRLSKIALKELTESGDMSIDTHRREILAEDDEIERSWLVYSKFDESMCKIKRFNIPDNWNVFTGHDFGTANPAALFVAQVKLPIPPNAPPYLRYGDYVIFAEYSPGAGVSPVQHVDRYKEIMGDKLRLEGAVGGNITTEEETRILYRRLGWPIKAPSITKVPAQIDHVIALMEAHQLYIFEDLHKLLAQINNCMWVLDANNQPTNKVQDEARYHLLACLRYISTAFQVKALANDEVNETYWDDEDDEEHPRRRRLAEIRS